MTWGLGTDLIAASLETVIRGEELNRRSNDLRDLENWVWEPPGWVLGAVCG